MSGDFNKAGCGSPIGLPCDRHLHFKWFPARLATRIPGIFNPLQESGVDGGAMLETITKKVEAGERLSFDEACS